MGNSRQHLSAAVPLFPPEDLHSFFAVSFKHTLANSLIRRAQGLDKHFFLFFQTELNKGMLSKGWLNIPIHPAFRINMDNNISGKVFFCHCLLGRNLYPSVMQDKTTVKKFFFFNSCSVYQYTLCTNFV